MRAAKRWEHAAHGNSGCLRMIRADPSHPLNPCSILPYATASAGVHAIATRFSNQHEIYWLLIFRQCKGHITSARWGAFATTRGNHDKLPPRNFIGGGRGVSG